MRTLSAIVVVLFASVAFAATDWHQYRSTEGKFSVELPEVPAKASQALRNAAEATNKVVAVRTDAGSFMVSYVDSDTFDDDRNRLEAILDSTCNGAAAKVGATTLRAESLIRNGFVGRSVRFTGRDGTRFKGLVLLAGTRLYQAYASGDAEFVASKDVERFLNSFRIWK
ncbi:MAG: hypothetical protein ABIV13_00500 [Fimbriimonadales bacterium]